MDSAANSESPMVVDHQSESEVAAVVGDKRPLENVGTDEFVASSAKKANLGSGEMRRLAEIVLVLSTMAGMRGGRNPTEVELNLMTEARAKLVEICQDLTPEDLVVKDAIGTLVEDLGFNCKLRDQRLGYRGSRLTIKDKFSLANMKIEESKKYNATPAYTSQIQTQPSFGANTDNRGPSHSIHMYQSDKPSNPSLTSGGPPSSAQVHVPTANSTSVTHLFNTDVRTSTVSAGISHIHPITGSGVDKTHIKAGVGSNGTNYASQVQANALGNQPSVNAPAWSLHSHSLSSIKTTPESKVNYNAGKFDGVTQAANQVVRPHFTQATTSNFPNVHQSIQGAKYVQTSPLFNNHYEIATIVHKLLQPELPQHPMWTPPSREYMYKPLACQMCHAMMNEVESVVVCDACEKGFHLKCLETINQKGIPRGGEWHCIRCTTLSNGKPLPPKYGRVMRSATQMKGASNSPGAQPSLLKKSEAMERKVSQDILTANGSSVVQDPTGPVTATSNDAKPESDLKVLNGREVAENSMAPAVKGMDQGPSARSVPDNSKSLDLVSHSPSVGLSSESSSQPPEVSQSLMKEEKSVSESNLQTPISLGTVNDKMENSKPSENLDDIGQTKLSNYCEGKTNPDNNKGEDLDNKKEHSDMATSCDVRQSEVNVTDANAFGSSEANEHDGNPFQSSEANEHDGNPFQSSDANGHDGNPFQSSEANEHDGNPVQISEANEHDGNPVQISEANEHDGNAAQSSEANEHDGNAVQISEANEHDGIAVRTSEANEHDGNAVQSSEANEHDSNAVQSSEANEQTANHTGMSSDGSHNVKWVGNALKVADGKTFYDACVINEITYKVHDHALFCSGNEKITPSKLQAMWEDNESGSKWVAATLCYFPGDLPEAVGHPCAPESNEVYESNHEKTMMASLIQGTCEVLPPTKFQENRERQNELGVESNKELHSVFLCKWFYDKSKGNFRPLIG